MKFSKKYLISFFLLLPSVAAFASQDYLNCDLAVRTNDGSSDIGITNVYIHGLHVGNGAGGEVPIYYGYATVNAPDNDMIKGLSMTGHLDPKQLTLELNDSARNKNALVQVPASVLDGDNKASVTLRYQKNELFLPRELGFSTLQGAPLPVAEIILSCQKYTLDGADVLPQVLWNQAKARQQQ